jgi:Fe-Mn family superoxide dismutase
METTKSYSLPKLRYGYKDLEPNMSEEQLTIHHDKHHLAYVNGANAIFEKMEKARKDGVDFDVKSTLKELSFHIGGHLLHSLFWDNMAPAGEGGGVPGGYLGDEIGREFGSFDRFKKEFSQAANSVEGSGWAALAFGIQTKRPLIMQIEKHNVNVCPTYKILLVLDVWEHAYYIDHKNLRPKFVDAFWNIVNWKAVSKRLDEAMRTD